MERAVILVLGLVVGAGAAMLVTGAGPVHVSLDGSGNVVQQAPTDRVEGKPVAETPVNPTTRRPNVGTGAQPADSMEQRKPTNVTLARAIHERINEVRKRHGLSELRTGKSIKNVAEYHSRDMATRGYFAHEGPQGETMEERYEQFDLVCRIEVDGTVLRGAENIYKLEVSDLGTYSTGEIATRIVQGWMDSDPHRKNILRPQWQYEGIGVTIVENPGETEIYVTQNFC